MFGWLRRLLEHIDGWFDVEIGHLEDGQEVTSDAPCRCEDGPYFGAQLAGTPPRCERCRLLVDDLGFALSDALGAVSLVRLEIWARDNPEFA